MSESAETAPPTEGALSAILEYLPAGWTERLSEILDLGPAQLDWLGGESARVGGNLLLLLERGWPEMAAIAGRLALFALAGSLFGGAVAAVVGWVLYLVVAGPLLRRGWRTGRLIGCFAATTVFLCAAAGGAWAGVWLGAGKVMEEAIEERYVVERLAAATFLAFTLDEGEIPREVDPDQVEGLLASAQRRSADSWDSFRAHAESAGLGSGRRQSGWLEPELMIGAVGVLGGGGAPDLAALHGVLSTPAASSGEDVLPQTAGIRKRAVSFLRGTVYAQAATGLGFGLVLPLAALVLFALLGFLIHRGREPDRQDQPGDRH
jgi:hypothetical protein